MLSEFDNVPIKKGDTVRVVGKNTGIDGVLATVMYVDNLTAMATVQQVNKYGYKTLPISKLEIHDRPSEQLKLF